MKICAGVGTEVTGSARAPRDLVEDVRRAEADGFPAAWCVHFSRGVDAITWLAAAGAATTKIELGVGIVPTYPRHPVALAQQAATMQSLTGGRFVLGVGVSHKPGMEGMHGIPYERPAHHMREYLSVLGPLLDGGQVSYQGEMFRVEAAIEVPGTSRVPIVVGALSPKMVATAGELADGVVTWLVGARSLEHDVTPVLRKAASEAGRGTPRAIVGLPILVCDDLDGGRKQVDEAFARYGTLVNYQRQFEREGVSGPSDVALVGDEKAIEDQLRSLASAGATDIWPTIIGLDSEPGSEDRALALLRRLTAEMA